jgi:outer membrane protein OmpA-like peptidoglycan-associated protein
MVLTLGGDVLFKTGSATVSPGALAQLDRIAKFLNQHPDREIAITGHTDNTGSLELNEKLSEQRAAAVGAYLVQRGVAANRIATRGMGPSMPIAPNDTAEGRQQNRRVDIIILDPGQKAAEHVLSRP